MAHVIIDIQERHGKILLDERYRAPNWKSRLLYILAGWMKVFVPTARSVGFQADRRPRGEWP